MKKITAALSMGVLMSAMCFSASASMVTGGAAVESSDFTHLNTAWNPNGAIRLSSDPAAEGSATWSIMGAGIADAGTDSHGANLTTLMTNLPGLSGSGVTIADIATVMNNAIDLWAGVSGFTNLGQVADGGGSIGAAGGAGGNGDIRIGAIFIDGGTGSNTLAHAFNPCNAAQCGSGGSVGGDTHFDDSNSWFISADAGLGGVVGTGSIDLFTVAIHEIGHALGMGHSSVVGSIMEPVYAGVRSSLHADDIAGIQALYGAAVVPVPGALVLFLSGGLGMIGLVRRKRIVK